MRNARQTSSECSFGPVSSDGALKAGSSRSVVISVFCWRIDWKFILIPPKSSWLNCLNTNNNCSCSGAVVVHRFPFFRTLSWLFIPFCVKLETESRKRSHQTSVSRRSGLEMKLEANMEQKSWMFRQRQIEQLQFERQLLRNTMRLGQKLQSGCFSFTVTKSNRNLLGYIHA